MGFSLGETPPYNRRRSAHYCGPDLTLISLLGKIEEKRAEYVCVGAIGRCGEYVVNAISASFGIYSVRDASNLTGVPPRQIRGWMEGYAQRRGAPEAGPILVRQHAEREGELALGFLDLLEVAFLGRIVQAAERQGRALSWRAIRAAAVTARRKFGTDHPFATKRMHSDGRTIFFEAQKETGDPALYDLVADNFAIYDVLADSFIASVEFEDDQPRRWVPDERFPRILIDPKRAFGRPIEIMSGAPAEALFDAWRAEKSDAAKVAAYFGSDEEGVNQAVGFTLGAGLVQSKAA